MNNIHERLTEAWAEARGGRGAVVHLVGAIGSGRSTHLNRFLDAVGEHNSAAAVVAARCGETGRLAGSPAGLVERLIERIAEGVRAIEVGPPVPGARTSDARAVPWLLPGAGYLRTVSEVAAWPDARDAQARRRAVAFARLMLDVAQDHAVLLALDDADRLDAASMHVVELIAQGLRDDPHRRLLVVLTSRLPLRDAEAPLATPWMPEPRGVINLTAHPDDELRELVSRRLARTPGLTDTDLDAIVSAARGNPGICEALVGLAGRRPPTAPLFSAAPAAVADRPGFAGLAALALGRLPPLAPHLRADLQAAALLGPVFEPEPLARLWQVPEDATRARIDALVDTGLVSPIGSGWRFVSEALPAELIRAAPAEQLDSLRARLATALRAAVRARRSDAPPAHLGLDVTETWSESRRRDRRLDDELDRLWAAAHLFALAGRRPAAAEAALTLAERLFEAFGRTAAFIGRFGRRADRERRRRLSDVIEDAQHQLALAKRDRLGGVDPELLGIDVRLHTARARFRQMLGQLSAARTALEVALELSGHLTEPRARLEPLRAEVEICYTAGDQSAGREALRRLLDAAEGVPGEERVATFGWIAEVLARWEWPGLHDRIYPFLFHQLRELGAPEAVIRARVERLAATMDGPEEGTASEALLAEVMSEANELGQLPSFAELLATYASELITAQADAHYDSLSGEFFHPDLFDEGIAPAAPPLQERMARPVDLLMRAEIVAEQSGDQVCQLRVLTATLGVIYDVRERFGDLLARWMPAHGADEPVRLTELIDLLKHGFFAEEHVEALAERAILLSRDLGLDQVLADTVFELLDRELPGAARRADRLFALARAAYERVGDAYGQATLWLVEGRYLEQRGLSAEEAYEAAGRIVAQQVDPLSDEQRAFLHFRLGERLVEDEDAAEEAAYHLEHAIRYADRAGDVEQVQLIGELLRELYRRLGDLRRYRTLRDRFVGLERQPPGVDPLGLELRIEHLLSLARQESDDERAIEMVERCVQLFGRMPDGTTRIDECFVEISKICRRRADESETEAGVAGWLQRSLGAVQTAASINRELGNYHRVFEEYHELFDDLLGLGAFDEYFRARAESRELAFAVGHVSELLYLFDEHIQHDPDVEFDVELLPEVRGFYEALVRYLTGLDALEQLLMVQRSFVSFLTGIGRSDLADHYRRQWVAG